MRSTRRAHRAHRLEYLPVALERLKHFGRRRISDLFSHVRNAALPVGSWPDHGNKGAPGIVVKESNPIPTKAGRYTYIGRRLGRRYRNDRRGGTTLGEDPNGAA